MGGSQSSQIQTNIRNAINMTINNYTTTINNTINKSTNEALNNLISNNLSALNALCNTSNVTDLTKCNMTSLKIDIQQNLNVACVSDMMAKISTDTSWQN